MTIHKVEREIDGVTYTIETGRLAKQADGAVTITAGGTIVLVTAVMSDKPKEGYDFLPLMVDYREQFYSAGKVPGGFFKRESRPDERQTLTARLIDRPIRPLMPKGMYNDIIITALVISSDGLNLPDILAMNGASAALAISRVPFNGPIGGVRVGRQAGKLITNPTLAQSAECDLSIMIAATKDAISMVEGGANVVSEDDIAEALDYGKAQCSEFIAMIDELVEKVQPTKYEVPPVQTNTELEAEVRAKGEARIFEASANADKVSRAANLAEIGEEILAQYAEREDADEIVPQVKKFIKQLETDAVRKTIIEKGQRPDGRKPSEIRPISIELSVLPGAHGSAIFTRGQTQALGVTTLGTTRDKRRRDDIQSEGEEGFLFHYNFPPFCVGEAKAIRATSRREIGHGALAGRAIEPLLPSEDDFPYMIRVVSEILECNGSSSMASVCAGSLSLMDAGVPTAASVAGIAMGLISDEQGRHAILTDIQGAEDHFGDMDFKVAGTRDGITSLQMDIKISGLDIEIMKTALNQAKEARIHILDIMDDAINAPRTQLAEHAPRLITISVPERKIRDVIGPGGKMIRKIQSESGAELNMDDDGTLTIAAWDNEAASKAKDMVEQITAEVEVGKVYEGKVARLMNFGAFVEVLPGQDGLVHISQLDVVTPRNVEDVVQEGDIMKVKVIEVDDRGRINLSRKVVLLEEQGLSPEEIEERYKADMSDRPSRGSGGRDRGDRGGRGGDRDRGGRSGGRDRDRGGRSGGDRGGRSGSRSSRD